ncbi:hypothetical protein M0R04_06460 [Candidatus Dojkabacteria bacterium]|jgi:hypothetical protein|nr:hypothetical protein [Candidatus Dojkabacteria bacterium]
MTDIEIILAVACAFSLTINVVILRILIKDEQEKIKRIREWLDNNPHQEE